ncbi:MAG: phosphoribosylformylglycinamidine synthase [Dehalococcoidia bacterium]|nr:phosphoribosylformylglycinamidine synthase [Dehalococcoidia bacterium]
MFLAKIYVTLKPTVNDPQGLTVRGGLRSLGFLSVESVRIGKYMEISVRAKSEEEAASQVRQMCQKLLANAVIEQFRFDLEQVQESTTAAPIA